MLHPALQDSTEEAREELFVAWVEAVHPTSAPLLETSTVVLSLLRVEVAALPAPEHQRVLLVALVDVPRAWMDRMRNNPQEEVDPSPTEVTVEVTEAVEAALALVVLRTSGTVVLEVEVTTEVVERIWLQEEEDPV